MSLRKCPDCDDFHRGRAVVCRPCARERLVVHITERLPIVSYETTEADALADAVGALRDELAGCP